MVIGHGAEGAERGGLHDDGDDAEHRIGEIVDQFAHALAALAQRHQREAEQDGEQQHLQDVAFGEGADHAVGNDVEYEVDRLLLGRLLGEGRHRRRVGLGADAAADLEQVADDEADHQREGRDDFEIEQRLDADAADFLGALDMRDAGDHGAEDDRRDHHLDQLDEAVAERLDPIVGGDLRVEPAENAADQNGGENLHIKDLIQRHFLRCARMCRDCDRAHLALSISPLGTREMEPGWICPRPGRAGYTR